MTVRVIVGDVNVIEHIPPMLNACDVFGLVLDAQHLRSCLCS